MKKNYIQDIQNFKNRQIVSIQPTDEVFKKLFYYKENNKFKNGIISKDGTVIMGIRPEDIHDNLFSENGVDVWESCNFTWLPPV